MLRGGANLSAAHDVEAIKVVDAKTQRGIEAKSVTENTKSILTPMAGEEAIVHERLASVTSAGAGELAAKVVKDDRTIRREGDKSETEAISRHSEGNNNFIPKNLATANTEVYPSKSSLIEGRLMLQEVVHDNNCNSSETDHASMPLGIFASKSVSCRHSNADLHLAASLPSRLAAKKAAFTLAEVLITLGIIGVVAAITMPVLLSNVNNKVKAERVLNIKQKLSKVTDKMAVQSGLMGYENTEDFVKEMQKHLKIAKVCDNAHLDNCWPTKEVTLDDEGKTWEISKTKNAKTLKVAEADGDDWSDTVGIVTADGTAMILSYNKGCTFDVDKTGLKGNGAASNSLNCLAGVFDWTGGKKPNKLAKLEGDSNGDVLTLGKAGGLGSACSFEIDGKCYTAPFIPTPLTKAECLEEVNKGTLGIKYCYYGYDYWAGAVKQCGGVSKMPTMADLGKLATELYKGNPTVGAKQSIYSGLPLDTSKASSLGFTGSDFFVWSGEEGGGNHALRRGFGQSDTNWAYSSRDASWFQAVCFGE